MYKILRIICCVICAALLVACVFIFVYLGWVWGITVIVAAGAFFALTMLFKGLQEDREKKQKSNADSNPPEDKAEQNEEKADGQAVQPTKDKPDDQPQN